jgi:hydroxymethylbilane synthase
MQKLIIASRKSPLAMWQAQFVKQALEKHYPQLDVVIKGMSTKGDEIIDRPLTKIGGKGLFVKELEHALLQGEADIAVHSMKDVPMHLPEGLVLPVVCERGEVRDVLVSSKYSCFDELPAGARIGTSSARRKALINYYYSAMAPVDVRGNVHTRLKKLDSGEYDALIMAGAGLERLEESSRICEYISVSQWLPSPGQGALGIECRAGDSVTQSIIEVLDDPLTNYQVTAERAVSRALNGGCSVPLAAHADLDENTLKLKAWLAVPDSSRFIEASAYGALSQAQAIGEKVAQDMFNNGAQEVLDQIGR